MSDAIIIPPREFLGRETEVRVIREAIRAGGPLIAVSGPRGIGKTALTYKLFAHYRDHGYEFSSCISISAHSASWETLVDSVYRTLAPNSPIPRRPEDVEAEFVKLATTERMLIFLDNLEPECVTSAPFERFLATWLRVAHRSCLLISTREWNRPEGEKTVLLRLEGIKERSAILGLLGATLRLTFDENVLLDAASSVGNVPQKLIYLNWLQPTTGADLEWAARGLSAPSPSESSIAALRNVLLSLSRCAEAVVALGLLRAIEFPSSLLDHLFHTVCDAQPDEVAAAREQMLNARILLQATTRQNEYRVHPDVHLDLRRLAEERGRLWMRDVHRYAADFYLQRLDSTLLYRDQLVYHYCELQEYDLAYENVVNAQLPRWHTEGLALQLSPIIQELSDRSDAYPIARRATLLIELAHIASDLSRHRECISHLRAAMALLDGLSGDTPAVAVMRRRAWMLMAASNGDLGDNANCIYYYLKAIQSDPEIGDTQTALCMGYLGYQYCDLMDFERALQWSELALRSCAAERDAAVFAKNLCNRALVLYYSGHYGESRMHLEEAVKLLTDPKSDAADIRELGRVLSYLGLVYISERDVPLAVVRETLTNSVALTGRAGDSRRRAMSWGRLGIVSFLEGDLRGAVEKLVGSVRDHYALGDYRNLAFELMGLADVVARGFARTKAEGVSQLVAAAIATGTVPEDVATLLQSVAHGTYGYLLDFWFRCQREQLFARGVSGSTA
jgi:tetratricopeptide (TPR) repeat protein